MKTVLALALLLFAVSATSAQTSDAIKFDEFSGLAIDEEQGHLDEFANELRLQPTAHVYILSYAGESSCVGDAERNAKRAKTYLVQQQIPVGRIVTIDGGYKSLPTFELWIVPEGASPPNASPSVDPSEVVHPKSCYKTTTKKRTTKKKTTKKS